MQKVFHYTLRQRNVWGISDDIERSRTFARTLRPEPHRWWTAKYNNAPRYVFIQYEAEKRLFLPIIKGIVLHCIFRYKGEVSSSKLQSSRLYQSAPDLMYSEYLEQGLSRSSRTMSLCNKYVESCSKHMLNWSLLQKEFIRSKKKSCSNKFSGSKRLGCFVQRLPRWPGDCDERPRDAGHGDQPAAACDGQDHRAQGEDQQGQGQDQVSHQTSHLHDVKNPLFWQLSVSYAAVHSVHIRFYSFTI